MPRSHIIHRLGTRFVSGNRCRSWVRFMGPKCFTRSWGLGWGGHHPTYLYLTGVGSACKLPGSARAIARQD